MPPKLRIKSAGKSHFSRSDRSLVSKTYCPTTVNGGNAGRTATKSEFGLLGSNMQINLRLGGVMGTTTSSKRMAQSTPSLIGASCKSESVDCLHTSILRDSGGDSSARKIHSDRPATAGFVLHRSARSSFIFFLIKFFVDLGRNIWMNLITYNSTLGLTKLLLKFD